ncbi:MAG TPA: outer membrane lipoprotein chaperone LolA [Terriglobales bacterium]|nr:outer membrane lipoprotein chaperone LolA [Terriglobales bacterium]
MRLSKHALTITLTATMLIGLVSVATAQTDVHQIADRVDRHYNSLRTMQAEFTEIYKGAGMSRTESGTLWLKRPGRMRWDYRTPREKIFLTDGKSAWFYVPGEKQARKAPIKTLNDLRSPLAYLLGKTKLEKEFNGLSLAPDITPIVPGDVVLRGVPRNMADRVSDVILEVAPDGHFQRIVAQEADGSITEFRFSNERTNIPVPDAKFKFSPPAGVETVQANELSQ